MPTKTKESNYFKKALREADAALEKRMTELVEQSRESDEISLIELVADRELTELDKLSKMLRRAVALTLSRTKRSFLCLVNGEGSSEMDKSLRDHVLDLEKRLGGLNARLTEKGRTLPERNNIESEIRATQLVLDYYLRALQLERELSR
jgi:hypothetical protein